MLPKTYCFKIIQLFPYYSLIVEGFTATFHEGIFCSQYARFIQGKLDQNLVLTLKKNVLD